MDTYSVEYLKLCAARFVWPQQGQLTPLSRRHPAKAVALYGRTLTWAEWWEFKFGENYFAYAKAYGVKD